MDLRREMEFHVWVVRDLRIQEPLTLSQINRQIVFIGCDVGLSETHELLQFSRLLGGQPASLIKGHGIERDRGAIFMQQAILYDFKLQFADATNDLLGSAILSKELSNPFVRQLQ